MKVIWTKFTNIRTLAGKVILLSDYPLLGWLNKSKRGVLTSILTKRSSWNKSNCCIFNKLSRKKIEIKIVKFWLSCKILESSCNDNKSRGCFANKNFDEAEIFWYLLWVMLFFDEKSNISPSFKTGCASNSKAKFHYKFELQ